jgi:hypothetical protein
MQNTLPSHFFVRGRGNTGCHSLRSSMDFLRESMGVLDMGLIGPEI